MSGFVLFLRLCFVVLILNINMRLDLGMNIGMNIGEDFGKGFSKDFGRDFGLDLELVKYVQGMIVPRYDGFDGAHSRSHVESVIGQSLQIFSLLVEDEGFEGLDVNMVYVVAAYHDLGLCEGRDLHHLVSGRIVREDELLRKWFDFEQIEVMAQAVEDHRASAKNPPRSIYGRIVAEADRVIDPEIIIERTILYGLQHYQEYSLEEQVQRCVDHLCEKYGDGGYLKLQFENSPNAQRLEELRVIIRDEERLRELVRNRFLAFDR